ncbi:MAG: hypothetical protein JSV88_02520 [Candidatus Aminicenantes bacterium]|nr:MAG: hypothetical protein JSV88_02520 [Candidatus Aminicenantes bacterium]
MINKTSVTPVYVLFWLVFLVMVTTAALNLYGVEVKKIEIRRFDDFQEGQFKGTALDSKGRLFIGPRIKDIARPGREYYLSLDTAANGDIYVGTGHQASVYRISPTAVTPPGSDAPGAFSNQPNNVEMIFESDEDLDVYAVLVTRSGNETVYAATSPDGKVYKITKNKGRKEFFNPDEKFIWDLKEDRTENIICAVGNSGGVYQVAPSTGQAVQIFASEDTHIISLYITRSNSILAGSGDRGILYRIDNRKVKVLFDSPFEEIRGICEDNEGNIYFSATKEIYLTSQIRIQRSDEKPLFLKKKEKETEETKTVEKSVLYCLHTDGIVEKIWASETEYIYSAFYDSKNNSVIIGTGDAGRLYSVKPDGSFAIIYESDSAQVFKIAGKKKNADNGFTLLTNNTAGIVEIQDILNNKGIYYSDIFDLQIQSRLGRIYWEANTSLQTEVLLFIRTGNSNVPDNTWTQWSAPFTNPENSSLNISGCRYFQVKAVLTSKNATETPYLEHFKIFYVQSNLGPQLKKIEIKKPTSKPAVRVYNASGKTKTTPEKARNTNYLTVLWEAKDLNKDKLKYNIYIKKYNARNWILIKEDITEKKLELDVQLYQDGKYVLRVEADDSLSNPPSMAKSNDLVSSPFLIDSTAPEVSGFSVAGNRIRFTVEDKTSIIANVFYSFDGKLWYPVFPVDTINDSKTENFDFSPGNLQAKKFIFLRVMDEFENCKVFQEEF